MMNYGCECGYEDCGVCGPHIEASRKQEEFKEKQRLAYNVKMNKLIETTTMPFGKHKGLKIGEIHKSYFYVLTKHIKLRSGKLKDVIEFYIKDYNPYRNNQYYSLWDDIGQEDIF